MVIGCFARKSFCTHLAKEPKNFQCAIVVEGNLTDEKDFIFFTTASTFP